MKIFWADREGKSPPSHCTFHFRPFSAGISSQKIQIVNHLPKPTPPIKVLRRTFSPNHEKWIEGVKKSVDAIIHQELQKVVLARTVTLELEATPNPFAIAAALQLKAEGAFVFCIQTPEFSFLGASPERLFSRKGKEILSEAIAGTRKRGKTPEEDETLKRELLASAKDMRELSPIQTYLNQVLSPICKAPIIFSPISVHAAQNVQHLYSRCSALLNDGITDEEILERLHPTPALCGTPKEKALKLIEELEPFQRGLYGGAIGWKTPEASEWIVGIRSCLIQGKTATLFSGTGIVEGSDPEEEWEELDQKLRLYEGILL